VISAYLREIISDEYDDFLQYTYQFILGLDTSFTLRIPPTGVSGDIMTGKWMFLKEYGSR